MSNHFSKLRDPSYIGLIMWPECPMKGKRGRFYWLKPWESSLEVVQGPGGLHPQPCLVPSWCGASRITWNHCWLWRISSPPGDAARVTLPRGKAGMKMNGWICFWNMMKIWGMSLVQAQSWLKTWIGPCQSIFQVLATRNNLHLL